MPKSPFDGKKDIPPFKLVAYKGHTLQGNYEGAFVYAKEPVLPEAAIPAVTQAAKNAGLDFSKFTRIDNTWYVTIVMYACFFHTSTFTLICNRFTRIILQSRWRFAERCYCWNWNIDNRLDSACCW